MQLFNPITCERDGVTYEVLENLTGKNRKEIKTSRNSRPKVGSYYIIDQLATNTELGKLCERVKLEDEIWKETKEYKGYMVSNYGRIKSLKNKGRILLPKRRDGEMKVNISPSNRKWISIRNLVKNNFSIKEIKYDII